jgi:hypothetical protein
MFRILITFCAYFCNNPTDYETLLSLAASRGNSFDSTELEWPVERAGGWLVRLPIGELQVALELKIRTINAKVSGMSPSFHLPSLASV